MGRVFCFVRAHSWLPILSANSQALVSWHACPIGRLAAKRKVHRHTRLIPNAGMPSFSQAYAPVWPGGTYLSAIRLHRAKLFMA